MSAKTPGGVLVATAAALYWGPSANSNWPDTVVATPARDFASDSTRSFFGNIRIPSAMHATPGAVPVRIVAEGPSDVYVVTTTINPGGYSGWHTHPGPSVVLVKTGTAKVYDGNDPTCTPATYKAGSGFVDAGGGHVHLVRNAGTQMLELVAFQIIPTGAARRIDAPDPGFCPSL